jgi:methionine synthase I (cobalamin-dependent)
LLYNQYNLKIVGGCCGTNDKFIEGLSKKITSTVHNTV